MITAAARDRFIELRAQGFSYDHLAQHLKISKHTLIDWGRTYAPAIENLRTIHLETLAEKFQLLTRHRLQWLGQQITQLRQTLSQRDFSDVPTPKLLDMLLKLYRAVPTDQIDSLGFQEVPSELLSDAPDTPILGDPFTYTKPTVKPPAPPTDPILETPQNCTPSDENPSIPPDNSTPTAPPSAPATPARTKSAPVSNLVSMLTSLKPQPGSTQTLKQALSTQTQHLANITHAPGINYPRR